MFFFENLFDLPSKMSQDMFYRNRRYQMFQTFSKHFKIQNTLIKAIGTREQFVNSVGVE